MTTFRAVVAPEESTLASGTLQLVPGENLRTGVDDFGAVYPDFTSLESDTLTVASAIYACDLAFKRGQREEITRSIEVSIQVVNHAAFEGVKADLELLLWTLSHDNWTVNFQHAEGDPEPKKKWRIDGGSTILFSGGVDSFVGAIDILTSGGPQRTQLASHVTGNPITRQSQDDLAAHLGSRFGAISRITVRSGGRKKGKHPFPSDSEREETQRARSFMFLTVAALAARRSGHNKLVVIAENGQMAIHLPLSPARIGAFSTHTAHPEFVSQAKEFFSRVLDFDFQISNPYLYATKAEVVGRLGATDRTVIDKSVSCWRGSRVSAVNHCGECIPCLVRRIALEHNGIVLAEYKRDLFRESITSLPEDDDGKRNIVELAEFSHTFATQSNAAIEMLFPDLISPDFDKALAIGMYRRFANEADAVLRKYAGTSLVLPPRPTSPSARGGKGT